MGGAGQAGQSVLYLSHMSQSQVGLIGLAVMGSNLARNFARRGFSVSVYNRTSEKTAEFIKVCYTFQLLRAHPKL